MSSPTSKLEQPTVDRRQRGPQGGEREGLYVAGEQQPVLGCRRTKDWVQVARGLHRPREGWTDLEAWRLLLPDGGRFTHLTAARALGWWLPPTPADLPVFVAIGPDELRPRRPGLQVRRTEPTRPSVVVDGLPMDHPAEVLLDCARDLSLIDLVVLADSAVRAGACSLDELRETAARRRRGAPLLRRALHLVDARSESPYESLLRVLHVVCEVAVEPQHVIRDEDGGFVARADLWLVGTAAIHEYDGADHLDVRQQRHDLARSRRIGNHTWVRRGYTADDVLRKPITILRDADLSLGRAHQPQRIRPWHHMLAESLFTGAGAARLRTRLRLQVRG